MKSLLHIILLLVFVISVPQTKAQDVNRLLKKATQKLEQKTEAEADKIIDEEIDKLFEKDNKEKETQKIENDENEQVEQEVEVKQKSSSSKREQQQSQAFLNMMGMGANIPTENAYNFSSSIKMEMESFDAEGNSGGKTFYESFINPHEKTYAMKFTSDDESSRNSEGLMIFDYKNKAMIILSSENGEKSGMVTPIAVDETDFEEMEKTDAAYDEEMEKYTNLKKTGNTKKILGYNCDEYVYQDEQGKISYWFSDDVDIFNSGLFGGIEGLSMFFAGQMPKGMMLQMESENFTNKEKSTINVKEINENTNKNISLEGYQLISIGAPPQEEEKTEE